MKDEERIQKVDTDRIEGEYILKDTDPDKKKIIFSTVIWYDPETKKYYFKSESDMNGNRLAGQVVSHKLIQDLLTISKWTLKPLGKLWDNGRHSHSLNLLKSSLIKTINNINPEIINLHWINNELISIKEISKLKK